MHYSHYLYPYQNVNTYQAIPHHNFINVQNYERQLAYWTTPYTNSYYHQFFSQRFPNGNIVLQDYGPNPYVVDINQATLQNDTFRTALWTGSHFQITLMSLNPGEDIGLEMHPDVDQFLRIEQGEGIVQMGDKADNLTLQQKVYDDYSIVIPAGTWHNLTNTGNTDLKLYSIYAPPNHPFGTVHATKADAEAEEHNHTNGNTVVFGKTPDEWIKYTEFLVEEGLEDVKRGINATHILQEFILMGVLVGKGYSPEEAYETVERWEQTGESKLLQQSKNM